ncbi:MAG: hypothetical protein WC384_16580 [Prolixibacteraceae bacterium]|jgi:hypothetical protein
MDREVIFKKLKFGSSWPSLIVNAPEEYLEILNSVEFDSVPLVEKTGSYGFVQVFASSQAEMEKLVKSVAQAGKHDCIFWACYPKSTPKQKYDLKRETVWEALALGGLRPVSKIAIDEKWSALRGRDPELVGK